MNVLNVLINPLKDFFDLIVKGIHGVGISSQSWTYFLALFIFTLIIKFLILPLTIKQTRSMVLTQEMQPKIKALQEKYKNDPKTLQQKQMELYKESGSNPLSGCLPLLIQFPIFIAMYNVIRVESLHGLVGVRFLWVPSLAKPDPYFGLPILSGISTYVSMLITQPKKSDDPTVKTQRQMGIFMSAFSVWIGLKFQSALVLYWIIGNIIQLAQQYFIVGKVKKQEEEKVKLRKAEEEKAAAEKPKIRKKVPKKPVAEDGTEKVEGKDKL